MCTNRAALGEGCERCLFVTSYGDVDTLTLWQLSLLVTLVRVVRRWWWREAWQRCRAASQSCRQQCPAAAVILKEVGNEIDEKT